MGSASVNPFHWDPKPVARTVRAGTVSGESDVMVDSRSGGLGGFDDLNQRGWIAIEPPVGGKNQPGLCNAPTTDSQGPGVESAG